MCLENDSWKSSDRSHKICLARLPLCGGCVAYNPNLEEDKASYNPNLDSPKSLSMLQTVADTSEALKGTDAIAKEDSNCTSFSRIPSWDGTNPGLCYMTPFFGESSR